ncbi:MAG TPA: hypothetical protein GXZ65_08135 [Clostridiales bacterium]|nr:hypothetical protein [Clostridiales bacterium]
MMLKNSVLRHAWPTGGGGGAPRVLPARVGSSRKITYARGSAGSVNITTVPPKTAAMLMAIVADELKVPLNELRFISIKEKGPAK